MTNIERFWKKTKPSSGGCIDWISKKDKDGYGIFREYGNRSEKRYRAHMWIYQRVTGESPPVVMHSCDRPCCVALQHLSAGDVLANNRDSCRKGRRPHGSAHYHSKLDDDTVAEIRAMRADGCSMREICSVLSVPYSTAGNVIRSSAWKHVPAPPVYRKGEVMCPVAAILLRQLKKRGAAARDLEYAFGLSRPSVNKIASGATWRDALSAILDARVLYSTYEEQAAIREARAVAAESDR